MSSPLRGWLVLIMMVIGALIIVQLTATTLETYETRSGEHEQTQALGSD